MPRSAPVSLTATQVHAAYERAKNSLVELGAAEDPPATILVTASCSRCFNPLEFKRPANCPPGTFSGKLMCERCAAHVADVEATEFERPARRAERPPFWTLASRPRAEAPAVAPDIGPADLDVEAFARAAAELLDEPPAAKPEPAPSAPVPDRVEAPPVWIAPPEPRLEPKETPPVPNYHLTSEVLRERIMLREPWTCACGFTTDRKNVRGTHLKACDGRPFPKSCARCGKVQPNGKAYADHAHRMHGTSVSEMRSSASAVVVPAPPANAPEPAPVPVAEPIRESPSAGVLSRVATFKASIEATLEQTSRKLDAAKASLEPVAADPLAGVAARFLERIRRREEAPDPLALAAAGIVAAAERLNASAARATSAAFGKSSRADVARALADALELERMARGAREVLQVRLELARAAS